MLEFQNRGGRVRRIKIAVGKVGLKILAMTTPILIGHARALFIAQHTFFPTPLIKS